MIRIQEIREQLVSYIANEVPFAEFEDWLIERSWDMHKDSAVDAQQLVDSINASIYKYLDRYIDEGALKRELLTLVQEQTVNVILFEGPAIRQSWESQAIVQSARAAG